MSENQSGYYINQDTGKKINWKDLDFGTPTDSKCGICGCEEEGYWKGDILLVDTICKYCNEEWKFELL